MIFYDDSDESTAGYPRKWKKRLSRFNSKAHFNSITRRWINALKSYPSVDSNSIQVEMYNMIYYIDDGYKVSEGTDVEFVIRLTISEKQYIMDRLVGYAPIEDITDSLTYEITWIE